ncbi:MAG: glycosyltransferase family 4 protein [Pseudomonadota bacterium]
MATRIAFLNTHPIQYFAPMYARLNRAADLDVHAFYLSDFSMRGAHDPGFGKAVTWDVDLTAGYTPIFIDGAAQRGQPGGFFSYVAPKIWSTVRRGGYDALIFHGYRFAAHNIALAAARSMGIPVFMRGETHLGLYRPGWKQVARDAFLRRYLKLFAGYLAISSRNAEYYRYLGAADDQIFHVPYAVDVARFAQALDVSPDDRAQLRASWGVTDDRPVILFAAKFEGRKHPDDLIQACKLLAERGVAFHLVLVGSGALEGKLREMAKTLPDGTVSFPGFVNQQDLPRYYGASEVFVLPSVNEPFGLAVNEAMAAGLPIVLTREIGCVPDLLREGVNGQGFDSRDIAGLADALEAVIGDPARQAAMSQASRDLIATWDFDACLAGVRTALKAVGKL